MRDFFSFLFKIAGTFSHRQVERNKNIAEIVKIDKTKMRMSHAISILDLSQVEHR